MFLTKKKIISLLFALFILALARILNQLNSNVSDITEIEKCPACFGLSICQDINEDKINFEYSNSYSIFNNLFSIKNTYYGIYKDIKVIIKKLAYKSELDFFDKTICSNSELLELCFNKPEFKSTKTNFYKLIVSELTDSHKTDLNNKIRLCPTTAKISELLQSVQIENSLENEDYYKFIWTLIKLNPEPIVLQILSSKDGWPTPKYFGACGRVIVEEYIGLPLSSFSEEPWIRRAKISSSLLDAAYMFTFKNPNFAFYLTDISIDNIAVNDQDRAIFIDLENIIIVDRYPSKEDVKKIETWNQTYANDIDIGCEDCFIFSPIDICNHKISDHNYYAICQHILTQGLGTEVHIQGFLHNTPDHILEQYPTLSHLLKQCAKPDPINSRIDIGIQLKKVLDTIIKSTK